MAVIVRKEVDFGDVVRVRATYTDPDTGDPIDPDDPSFSYRTPNGELVTLTYPTDVEVVRQAEGIYYILVEADESGSWPTKGFSVGDGQAAAYGEIIVGKDTTAASYKPQIVLSVARRSDGTLYTPETIRIAPGERLLVGWDCGDATNPTVAMPAGARAVDFTTPSGLSGDLSAAEIGTDGRYCTIAVIAAGAATPGDEQWVRVDMTHSKDPTGAVALTARVLVTEVHP